MNPTRHQKTCHHAGVSCMIPAVCGRSLCWIWWCWSYSRPQVLWLCLFVKTNSISLGCKRKVEVKCSLTRSGVAPHLCSASRPGKLRSGPASLEPTQRRRSASPCLIYWGHPAAKHKAGHIHWIKDFLFNKQESCVCHSLTSLLSQCCRAPLLKHISEPHCSLLGLPLMIIFNIN